MIVKPLSSIEHTAQVRLDNSYTHSANTLDSQLNDLATRQQWIMFTAQCPRSYINQLASHHACCEKVIQLMASRHLSEFDVVEKAIRSNNASAIVASSQLTTQQQAWLVTLAQVHHCQLFFIDNIQDRLH